MRHCNDTHSCYARVLDDTLPSTVVGWLAYLGIKAGMQTAFSLWIILSLWLQDSFALSCLYNPYELPKPAANVWNSMKTLSIYTDLGVTPKRLFPLRAKVHLRTEYGFQSSDSAFTYYDVLLMNNSDLTLETKKKNCASFTYVLMAWNIKNSSFGLIL